MEVDVKNLDFKSIIENQKEFSQNYNKKSEVIEYDFKIVSFKLGQEFFGIDILNVKEIKKIRPKEITLVPNTLEFVKGVLNLRGEIISIIDLESMFHLNFKNEVTKIQDPNEILSVIVIKVNELKIGLIVTEIQRVVSLRRKDIQPPSPLLGSINEKFIKGVVEINQRLYVIFDSDAVFSDKTTGKKEVLPQVSELSEDFFNHFCNQFEELGSVHINDFNKIFIRQIYNNYIKSNNVKELPQIDKKTSDNLLQSFYSKHTGEFWKQPYIDQFKDSVLDKLGKICSEEIRVLIVGCSYGFEALSVFFILQENFQDALIKMTAADSNLANISKASGLETERKNIPSWIDLNKYFMKVSDDFYKVKKEINNQIYFEFHDARNIESYSKRFDLVIARDLSLYFSNDEYKKFITEVVKKISSGGVFVVGDNENIGKVNELNQTSNKYLNVFEKK